MDNFERAVVQGHLEDMFTAATELRGLAPHAYEPVVLWAAGEIQKGADPQGLAANLVESIQRIED
jgi:hypothetical protein